MIYKQFVKEFLLKILLNIIERATKNKSSKQSHGNNACQASKIKAKLKLTGNQSKANWLKTSKVLIRGNKSEQMKQKPLERRQAIIASKPNKTKRRG